MKLSHIGIAGTLTLALMACAPKAPQTTDSQVESAEKSAAKETTVSISYAKNPSPGVMTGGQPSQAEFRQFKTAGYGAVINMRTPGESGNWDATALAQELGIDYRVLPVAGGAGMTKENALAFDAMLKEIGDTPVVVHCGSGNRVGGLYALRAFYVDGKSIDESLAIGEAHGMMGIAGPVRSVMEKGR